MKTAFTNIIVLLSILLLLTLRRDQTHLQSKILRYDLKLVPPPWSVHYKMPVGKSMHVCFP